MDSGRRSSGLPFYLGGRGGGTSGTKHEEKPLAFLVTRGERNGKNGGGRATCRVDSGETKAGRKGKKCLFRQRSDFPPPFRPLFPAFEFSAPTFPFFRPSPSPLSLLTPTWKLSESFLRGNVPIFPVFLEGEEDRRLAKLRGRMRNNGGEKDRKRRCGGGWNTDGGSVKGAPIDIFFDKTGNDELFSGVAATVSRLRIIVIIIIIAVIRDSPRTEQAGKV